MTDLSKHTSWLSSPWFSNVVCPPPIQLSSLSLDEIVLDFPRPCGL